MKFFDLSKQYKKISKLLKTELYKNFTNGDFIQGKNVRIFENEILKFTNSKYCLSCANGTDAIKIAIKSLNLKKNSYVIVPSYTWISTASSVVESGLKPIFCDVNIDSFVIDKENLKKCIKFAKNKNYKVSALISVDLFGNPVDYVAIKKICEKNKIKFISDAAQSFGAKYKNGYIGAKLCDALTTSFFPTKTLGGYGDGGAVFFNNFKTYKHAQVYAKNGQYNGNLISSGINSRLDTIQATILIKKLKLLNDETKKRKKYFQLYKKNLNKNNFIVQKIDEKNTSGNSVFTVLIKSNIDKNNLIKYLKIKKIPFKIYYSRPIHMTKFYKKFPKMKMENTLKLSTNTLSLPIFSYLSNTSVLKICKVLNKFN